MSDIENVKKLREVTGAGFKDCNLAIKESGGDIDKAIEILRIKGISKALSMSPPDSFIARLQSLNPAPVD